MLLILCPLVEVVLKLKPLELICARSCAEEHAIIFFKEPFIANDSNKNLLKCQKIYLREHYRNVLNLGIPIESMRLHAHSCNNAKPAVLLLFKVEEEQKKQHVTEGINRCGENAPKIISRHRVRLAKTGILNTSSMKFAKTSSEVNFMLRTASESVNICDNVSKDFANEMKTKLSLVEALECQNVLEDSILGNKILCFGETHFSAFIDILNKETKNEVAAH